MISSISFQAESREEGKKEGRKVWGKDGITITTPTHPST
jgi:hypothetical protein